MTLHDRIAKLLSIVPDLQAFQTRDYDTFYDEAERTLHVVFDKERDADDSYDIEPIDFIDGDILIHTAQGDIVGFSILETDLGKDSNP
ncbi:MAG: hypothetical protein NZM06_09750 [Chloroherpetonaceae bacterium]|nr:hypothetical protein [Chloroherpetonaceae bacterium]MDW8438697.1 hypothetical protein [Chloroherpetonaceae bacterium]